MRATMRCGAPCLRPAQSPKWVMTVTGTGGAPLAVPTHSAAAGSLIAAPMIGTRRRWLDGPADGRWTNIDSRLEKTCRAWPAGPRKARRLPTKLTAPLQAQAPFACCRPDARRTGSDGAAGGAMAVPVGYTRRSRIVAFHSHSCPPLRTRYTQRARKNDSASCARFACCTPRSTSCQRTAHSQHPVHA